MSSFEQIPYGAPRVGREIDVFADNPDPRCPVILLLDKSGSMSGEPISKLNAALRLLQDEVKRDALVARRAEFAIVSFGPVTTDVDFVCAGEFVAPALQPEGDTPMGRAIGVALDMLSTRKETYKRNGVSYYRPLVFLITDGSPTDSWQDAADRVRKEEESRRIAFFAVGVEGADFATLRKLGTREPLKLQGLAFGELFQWLSASLSAVSRSQPGTSVALPPMPRGWDTI